MELCTHMVLAGQNWLEWVWKWRNSVCFAAVVNRCQFPVKLLPINCRELNCTVRVNVVNKQVVDILFTQYTSQICLFKWWNRGNNNFPYRIPLLLFIRPKKHILFSHIHQIKSIYFRHPKARGKDFSLAKGFLSQTPSLSTFRLPFWDILASNRFAAIETF